MDARGTAPVGALPNVVIIGAMKCGTTSLHRYLDLHPDVAMSRRKELNFFVGCADGELDWARGNWWRGPAWYATQFDATAAVRGEASPGYTSPSHPEVAGRLAALIPDARLVYAVRDPVDRAVSQYSHHRREGAETREPEEALLDPGSQYVARGRYLERLSPFLSAGLGDRVTVVAQEQLRDRPRPTMRRLFSCLGIDDDYWSPAMEERRNTAPEQPGDLSGRVRDRLREAFRDDAQRLRDVTGEDFPEWSV
ncbi:sulfotransferase family protein [Blastococcus colisei]|uniref:Sulfotransferase family protein n=1 Tax=Blastococcus colisei TaxID=1564162 RepID=A0A543PFE4_9ACTN|nr:sulfotransferase [Blastococcus colisei]TQN42800.1 sulfotransferase family protein [Blastococcus colisei]